LIEGNFVLAFVLHHKTKMNGTAYQDLHINSGLYTQGYQHFIEGVVVRMDTIKTTGQTYLAIRAPTLLLAVGDENGFWRMEN
jgi:hypothetical protein